MSAEAEGFEPSIPFRVYRISSAAPSTTQARLPSKTPSFTLGVLLIFVKALTNTT